MIEIIFFKYYNCNYVFIYLFLLLEKQADVRDDVIVLVCSRDVRCLFSDVALVL